MAAYYAQPQSAARRTLQDLNIEDRIAAPAPRIPPPNPATALARDGWWMDPQGLPAPLTTALHGELATESRAGRLRAAGIGRGRDWQIDPAERGDRIRWLERDTLAKCQFLDRMEQIRRELNRTLFLGLFEFESHFAEYPPGAGYKRHFDSFRGAADRTVSALAYLNPQWSDTDGGELVLYESEGRAETARIQPRAGTLVLFLSEEVPHEVLPARRSRASIVGWFRRRCSRELTSYPNQLIHTNREKPIIFYSSDQ